MAANPLVSRRASTLSACTASHSSEQKWSACRFDDRAGKDEPAVHVTVPNYLRLTLALAIFALVQPLLFCSLGQSASPARDAEAIQILETAIDSMGGQSAWSRVAGASSKWDLTKPYDPHYSAVETWTDDWSLGFTVFKHEITAEDGTQSISADAHRNVINQWPGGQKNIESGKWQPK
jgi:hypothetical protein